MKTILALTLLSFTAGTILAAEPLAEIKDASKKLAEKPNYSWSSIPKSADGTPGRGPIQGKTEKGGFTYYTIDFNGTEIEVAFKGMKGAINLQGSWQTAEELEGGDMDFVSKRLKAFKAPAEEAEYFATKAKGLKSADGAISGELTEELAKELLTFRPGTEITDAKATVKFWIKDGLISKYEFQRAGKVGDRDVDLTTTVEINNIGSTTVTVPQEGKDKLK